MRDRLPDDDDPPADGQKHAQEAGGADEPRLTLAEELEQIAQRLAEIAQDDFGKVTWTAADIDTASNAVAAMKKVMIVIQRLLNNEK